MVFEGIKTVPFQMKKKKVICEFEMEFKNLIVDFLIQVIMAVRILEDRSKNG